MINQRFKRNLFTGHTDPLTAPLAFDSADDLGNGILELKTAKDQNNLRINFDKLISSTLDTSLFFKNFTPQKFITNSQKIVLEIKYTHYLPDHIQFLLNSLEKSRISFSKYANSIQ